MENNTENIEIKDAKVFAEAIEATDFMSPLYQQLTRHFTDQMYKAINGRICTRERMAKLYPIFLEINDEQEEMCRETAKYSRPKKTRRTK